MTIRSTCFAALVAATGALALALFGIQAVAHAGVLSYRAEDQTVLVDAFAGESNRYTVTTNVGEGCSTCGTWNANGPYVKIAASGGEQFLLHKSAKGMCWFYTDDPDDDLVGIECFRAAVARVRIYGGDRADKLTCWTATLPCTLIGGDGNDHLWHGTANDLLVGGGGDDVVEGDEPTYAGGAGDDEIEGGGGIDTLDGGMGDDTVRGDDGGDVIRGGAGHDILEPGFGDDDVYGGDGTDALSYDDRYIGIHAKLANGSAWSSANGGAGENDRARDVEDLMGGWGDDVLTGNSGPNNIQGGKDGDDDMVGGAGHDDLQGFKGNDTLDGGNGRDLLNGWQGDDTLTGGKQPDRFLGGGGKDTVSYAGGSAVKVTIDDVADDGRGNGVEGDDVTSTVEVVRGSQYDDSLTGGAGDERLLGEGGDDVLRGGAGADRLEGGPGIDTTLYSDRSTPVTVTLGGGAGDGYAGENDDVETEQVVGGSGDDVLTGTPAAEGLFGGPGKDTLDGKGGSDALYGNESDDTITSADGVADVVDCGAGAADKLMRDGLDNPVGCEQVTQLFNLIKPGLKRP